MSSRKSSPVPSDTNPVDAQPKYIPVGLTKAQWLYLLKFVKDNKETYEEAKTLDTIHKAIYAALFSFNIIREDP